MEDNQRSPARRTPVMGRLTSETTKAGSPPLDLDEGGWSNDGPPLMPARLTWRGVEAIGTAFSDWTIVVGPEDAEGDGADKTYHVHKNILSVGERASGYFHTQFTLETPTRENERRTSVLRLPPLCVSSGTSKSASMNERTCSGSRCITSQCSMKLE